MINSANTLDFTLCTTNSNNNNSNDKTDLLATKMVPTGNYNTIKMHKNDARTFALYDGSMNSEYACFPVATAAARPSATKEIPSQRTNAIRSTERVKVQHLQTHTTLQNNLWKPSAFFNLSAETERNVTDNRSSNSKSDSNNTNSNDNNSSNNVQNESAFTNDDDSKRSNRNNRNNNDNIVPVYTVNVSHVIRRSATPIHRTEDQENAFRRIEDVHNYAKLRERSYYNGSSASSVHEDEEEEDEEDDEGNEGVINHRRLFNKRPAAQVQTYLAEEHVKIFRNEAEEQETHVDVETLQCNEKFEMEMPIVNVAPDHHARRPMNAFLIFCKRHRAIVKGKYKSLENRAITKILGDWWASLDPNDKKCFTNLAEQNKAAFFSANPNFKWYKLPAPSLRTHVTRPNNTERCAVERESREELQSGTPYCNKLPASGNFFKLADEAQMGELSALINDRSKITQGELQQALGETTEFLTVHMPHGLVQEQRNELRNDNTQTCKRRLHSEHSLSSNNSSEDDISPRKAARSCKGKIYQELKNSGQIAAITKKVKPAKTQSFEQGDATLRADFGSLNLVPSGSPVLLDGVVAVQAHMNLAQLDESASQKRRVVSESDTQAYTVANFDLEEKIKDLPALSLEAYLQRKRNTKKKKKFSSTKKRNSNSTSSCKSSPASPPAFSPKDTAQPASGRTQAVAVGSQKRKARKESITRRNVSAIESEVASLMPPAAAGYTTVNGGYYFNESAAALPNATITTSSNAAVNWTLPNVAVTASATSSNANFDQIPYADSNFSSYSDQVSSTSDPLGLLAEVAANRTELTN